MAWWDTILAIALQALGRKRKRPPVNKDAQAKIDHAKAELKETKLTKKDLQQEYLVQQIEGARQYGITRRQWRKVDRGARNLGITFDQHWRKHPIRLRKIAKAMKGK